VKCVIYVKAHDMLKDYTITIKSKNCSTEKFPSLALVVYNVSTYAVGRR